MKIEKFLKIYTTRINNLLNKYLVNKTKNLDCAMRYSLAGGKRLRPLLIYAIGKTYDANLKILDISACAIEMIHCFSLIHDDLPLMDNDDLRRGRLTCHKAFSEATAVLAGNSLGFFAIQILAESKILTPKLALAMIKTLTNASGHNGMAFGQDLDLSPNKYNNIPKVKKLEKMYLLKTGELIRAAVKLGALAANIRHKDELNNLDQFAKKSALAFQIQDDILNIESNPKTFGKNIGTDNLHNKITYPYLVGVKSAKLKVQKLYESANKNLLKLNQDPSLLQGILNYLKQRNH